MDDEIGINVEHVSKKYCKSLKRSMLYGVTDIVRNTLGLSSHSENLRKNEFWAVDDVSFEVKKGEVLGIIGLNGSGKTTMLKMLNGIFWPDKGKISMKGSKVGALIAVGAGFHPLLTGRENVYINAAVLGMTKEEVDEKFDSIVEFADIGNFIDAPVKFYSSGMFVKLGFSVAVHCEPDILLIDEILSVGDFSFQNKSLRKLADVREEANTVVFVSHNLEHVKNICDKTMLLNNGLPVFYGDTDETILKYHELIRRKNLATMEKKKKNKGFELDGHLSSGDAVFIDNGILDKQGIKTNEISIGDDINLFFEFELKRDIEDLYFAVSIFNEKNINCLNEATMDYRKTKFQNISKGAYRLIVSFKNPNLSPGVYTPRLHIRDARTFEGIEIVTKLNSFLINGNITPRGVTYAESEWKLEKK